MQRFTLLLLTVLLGLVSYTQQLQFSSAIPPSPAREHTDIFVDPTTTVVTPAPALPAQPPKWEPPIMAEPDQLDHPERELITI